MPSALRAAFVGKPGRGQDPEIAELKRVLGETRDKPGEDADPLEDLRTDGALLGQLAQRVDYLSDWGQADSYSRVHRETGFSSNLGFWLGLDELLVVDVDKKL